MLYVPINMYMDISKVPSLTKVMFVFIFNHQYSFSMLIIIKKNRLLTHPVENSSVCL